MKHFLNILKYSLVLSLVVTMASCGGGDDDDGGTDVDPTIAIREALTKGTVTLTNSDVTAPEGASSLNWDDMTLKFNTDGTYSTNASPNGDVWPGSGTWDFKEGTDGKTIVRDGTTDVTIAVGETELSTTFTVEQPASGGRIKQIGGEWDFSFKF